MKSHEFVQNMRPRCRIATWICVCGHTRDSPSIIKIRSGVSEPPSPLPGSNFALSHYFGYWLYNSLCYRKSRDNFFRKLEFLLGFVESQWRFYGGMGDMPLPHNLGIRPGGSPLFIYYMPITPHYTV